MGEGKAGKPFCAVEWRILTRELERSEEIYQRYMLRLNDQETKAGNGTMDEVTLKDLIKLQEQKIRIIKLQLEAL